MRVCQRLPLSMAATGIALLFSLAPGRTAAPEYVPEQALVKFCPGTPASEVARAHAAAGSAVLDEIPQIGVQIVGLPPGMAVDRAVAHYQRNPNVEFAEPDYYVEPATMPNDPYFALAQRPLQALGATSAWDITTGSPSVVIAVLDSGIDYYHPDLQWDKFILGPDFYNNDNDPWDDAGHGTIVTGVVGAATNNSIGIAGTTWLNRILVMKIAGSTGYASWSALAKGITYAADQGARVANISYAGPTSSATFENAASYAYGKGVVIVASAGNGVDPPQYPAAYPEVIAVSGINGSDQWTDGYGSYIGLCAYAGAYTTQNPFGTPYYYGSWGGTSVAAPYVAGAAALVLSVNPALAPDQVRDIICQTADDLGDPGWDQYYGYGRVNLYRAVLAAVDSLSAPDTTPPAVSITAPQSSATVSGATNVTAAATDAVGVSAVEVYLDGALLGRASAAPYAIPWDTTKASSSSHSLQAVAYDHAGNWGVSAPVSVVVDNGSAVTETFSGTAGGRSGSPVYSVLVSRSGPLSASLSWSGSKVNLNLCLYDAGGALLAQATGSARPEVISAPVSAGTYRLQVVAASGKGSFTLSVTHP